MANKGKGKNSWKSPMPWTQKGPKELSLKGRNLISDSRVVGCICEWHGSWGWIEPLDVVSHPQNKKNRGRIYVHRTDARGYVKMEVGSQLSFQIFCDARGLGAIDCIAVEAGTVEAAGAEAAANDEVALPEGWEKNWSAENSEYFYYNRLTKESSWLPPQPASEEDDEEDGLPQGWSKHYDAEERQWYYWDKVKKKASWERPDAPSNAPKEQHTEERHLREPPAKKAKLSDESAATDAAVLGQQRVKGRVVEWHGFFGWIEPLQELSKELRPLLEKGDGRIYLNWRDVHPGLEMEAGMDVDIMLYEDDNGLAASDVRLFGEKTGASKPSGASSKLARQWADEDEAAEAEAAEAAAAEEGDDEENEGPLLPGWDQVWSDDHNCHYYWHKATKVAAWERPSMPVGSDDEEEEEAAEGDEKIWDGEGLQAGASHMATPMTPLVSKAGRAMTPATPGATKARGVATNHTGPQKSSTRNGGKGGTIKAAARRR